MTNKEFNKSKEEKRQMFFDMHYLMARFASHLPQMKKLELVQRILMLISSVLILHTHWTEIQKMKFNTRILMHVVLWLNSTESVYTRDLPKIRWSMPALLPWNLILCFPRVRPLVIRKGMKVFIIYSIWKENVHLQSFITLFVIMMQKSSINAKK